MLDRKLLRDNADAVVAGAARKGLKVPMAEWQAKYETWRHIKHDLDAKNQESNQVSKSIGALLAQGKKEEAEEAKTTTKVLKETI
jgi:seryl-tRNA synthetase